VAAVILASLVDREIILPALQPWTSATNQQPSAPVHGYGRLKHLRDK